MDQKTTIPTVFYCLLIFYTVSLTGTGFGSSAVAADAQPLVYSVRLMDSFAGDAREEAEEELRKVSSLGLDCRLGETTREEEGKSKINILCGKASSINGLQDVVKTVRENQYTFLIISTREPVAEPMVEAVSTPAAAETPVEDTASSRIRTVEKNNIKPGDIVYTLRLSNSYTQDSLTEAREQLDHLKELGLDCRLQESSSAVGRAAGRMYHLLCGQARTINGLQETVNRARTNHLTFLITLAPYSSDHRLEENFAGLPTVVPGVDAEEQGKEVAAAFSRFNAGDIGKAETLFTDILAKEPGNIDASFGLALVEVRRKNWAQAYVYIKPLLKQTKRKDIHSTATMIQYNREMAMGWDLVKTSPDKAIEAFMRARNYDKTPETMEGLAYAYYHKADYTKSLAIFEDIFAKSHDSHAAEMIISCLEKMEENDKLLAFYKSLDPEIRSVMAFNPERKQNLLAARQYIESGEYTMAERLLKEIYLLEPGNAEILNYFGWLYLKQRDAVKAEEYYRSALSLDPYNIDIMQGLAGALLALQREDEALIYLEKVQESGRDVVNETNKAKLAIYIRKHQFIQALAIAGQMEQKNPKDPKVHLLIAELYMNKNEREKAFNYYSRAYQLDNENFGVKINLLKYFLQDGRYDQIKLMLETFKGYTFTKAELEELRGFYHSYYDQYSAYLLANEEYEGAKLAAMSGLDLSPDDFTFLNRVAWVSLNMQDFERAAYYFQLALRQDPENIELWYGLGLCYLSVGDDESAAETLSRVENSDNVEVLYKLADAYQQIERYEDALRVADRANQLSSRIQHKANLIDPKVRHAMPGIIGSGGTGGSSVPRHVSKRDRLDVFNPFVTSSSGSDSNSSGGVKIPKFDFKTVSPTGASEQRRPFEREEAVQSVSPSTSFPAPTPSPSPSPALRHEGGRTSANEDDTILGPSPMMVPEGSDTGGLQKKKIIRSIKIDHSEANLADSVEKINQKSPGIVGRPRIMDWLDQQNGSSFAVGEYFRGRSGDIGLGKLTETALTFDGIFNWDKYKYLYGYANHLWLQSGIVPPQSYHLFGTPPITAPIHDNIGKIEVLEPGLGYYYDGPSFYLQAQLGFTPLNGVVDEQMTWKLKCRSDPLQRISGSFLIEEESVRESFLSFVGERDLYTNATWGGVTRQGVRGGIRYKFDERWELASELFFYPNIDGINTISNSEAGLTMLWSYNLELDGFDYFDVGPLFIYDGYDKNTNFFTYGHGGYFSPQFFMLAGIYFDFLRFSDSKDGFFRMTGNVGYLYYEEDRVKKYPFHPENYEYYSATEDSKIGGDIRWFAGYLLNDDWSLIASGGLQASMGYTSYYVGGSLVYHFGNHERMYVKDLRRSNIISRFLLE